MRLIRFLITVTMASVLLASGIMCVRMVQRQPVAMPALWVGGLILSLLYLLWAGQSQSN